MKRINRRYLRGAETVELKPKFTGERLGFVKPKKGELYFPRFMKAKTRHFGGKKYHQGAFSSNKKTIDQYIKDVLDKSGVKYRITKMGRNYQVWTRNKK